MTTSLQAAAPTTRPHARVAVLAAKNRLGPRWDAVAEALGRSTEWTVSALLGLQTLSQQQTEAAGALLDLDPTVVDALTLPPESRTRRATGW